MRKTSRVQNPACTHTLIHYQAGHQESDRKLALLEFPVAALWWLPSFPGNGEQTPHTPSGSLKCPSLPAAQQPTDSNLLPLINMTKETWRRGFGVYLCWNLFLTSFTLLLSERQRGHRRDQPRNMDMRSSTPIIVPPGSCWLNVPRLPACRHNSSTLPDEQSRII